MLTRIFAICRHLLTVCAVAGLAILSINALGAVTALPATSGPSSFMSGFGESAVALAIGPSQSSLPSKVRGRAYAQNTDAKRRRPDICRSLRQECGDPDDFPCCAGLGGNLSTTYLFSVRTGKETQN